VMDNGGSPVTQTKTLTVVEPASDAWVRRAPDANEKPVNGQFFARDDTGYGKIYYNGSLGTTPDSVYLKLYRTETGTDVPYGTPLRQTLINGGYAFTAPIAPGLVTYKVVFGSTSGATDTDVATVTGLMCGDAYIIDGQSNAVADNNGGNYGTFTNEWIRSFGNMGGGIASGWCDAVSASSSGDAGRIGNWGMAMAAKLVADYAVPVCLINGAVGGTRIDQHQANPADHTAAGSSYSIYANILNRVVAAKLTHGIRGILWHQGENNSGAAAPTGDWDYKSYQQYFMDMATAWKQDYPNIKHYYIFQVWPMPCSMGPKGDQLREAQRTLPRLFSNLSIMSTIGVTEPWNTRTLCHFDGTGYEQIADLIAPLVERDNNSLVPATDITAPNLRRAYFTSAARTAIALEFDQNMNWNTASTGNFYLDKLASKATSGSASGHVLTLQLSAASTQQTINYLEDAIWDGSSGTLLRGANNIAALTFADVPIGTLAPVALTATAGNSQVALAWTAPSGGATGYNVKRALSAGGTYALIGSATGTSYTDTAAVSGTTYYYLVTATTTVGTSVGESADSNVASATPASSGVTYASWMTSKGLTGGAAGDDPDHDGIPNALEYVLGGEPNPANAGSNSVGLLPKVTRSGNNLIFTYRRADIALTQPGIAITAEYGSSLTGWTAAQDGVNGVAITVTNDGFGTGIDRVEVSIPQALAVGAGLFVHLKVTLP